MVRCGGGQAVGAMDDGQGFKIGESGAKKKSPEGALE
jgi:hypothetical protein